MPWWVSAAVCLLSVVWVAWEVIRAPEVPARRDGDKPWET